jgi:hypothetical protein
LKMQTRCFLESHHRRQFVACLTCLLLIACAREARAQLCPGSHIFLVVRDERGQIIDPTPLTRRNQSVRTFDFVRTETIELPIGFNGAPRQALSLVYSDDGCTFRLLEESTFELNGKKMRLVFRNARRVRDRSVFYTIDLPPFRQGSFEIDLSRQTGLLSDPNGLSSGDGGRSSIFSAAAWRETSAAAPALPAAHTISLRGTVTNGATRLPMGGVKVELLLGELGEEVFDVKAMTGPEGHFEIAGVPDEKIINSDQLSVSAQPEGCARTQVFIDNHRTLAQSQQRFDEIHIEVRPLVTVRGRLLDTATGQPATITPGTLEASALLNEWLRTNNYRAHIYHPAKGEISSDGTFTLRVAVGKNSFYLADYQRYQRVLPGTRQEVVDQSLDLDIKLESQAEILFRVRRAEP